MNAMKNMCSKRSFYRSFNPRKNFEISNFSSAIFKGTKMDEENLKVVSERSPAKQFVRCASRIPSIQFVSVFTKEEKEKIEQVLPSIISDLTEDKDYSDVLDISKQFAKALHYNLQHCSMFYGCTIVTSYKILENPENLTPENVKLACILGACVEMFLTATIMEDDIYDKSETRRSVPCWYKIKNDPTVYNDINFMKHGAFVILKKYFSSQPFYKSMHDIVNRAFLDLTYGFALDQIKLKTEEMTLQESLRREKYNFGMYIHLLPVGFGMCLSKTYTDDLLDECRDVLHDLSIYFARENALMDIFSDPNATGKIGTDIELGKCNWTTTTALRKADTKQRELISKHYGKSEKGSIEIIHNIYNDLGLIDEFLAHRDICYKEMSSKINKISHKGMRKVLHHLCKKMCQREYIIE